MDLLRNHGYTPDDLGPLQKLSRAQGQSLMDKLRTWVARRGADQASMTLLGSHGAIIAQLQS